MLQFLWQRGKPCPTEVYNVLTSVVNQHSSKVNSTLRQIRYHKNEIPAPSDTNTIHYDNNWASLFLW